MSLVIHKVIHEWNFIFGIEGYRLCDTDGFGWLVSKPIVPKILDGSVTPLEEGKNGR